MNCSRGVRRGSCCSSIFCPIPIKQQLAEQQLWGSLGPEESRWLAGEKRENEGPQPSLGFWAGIYCNLAANGTNVHTLKAPTRTRKARETTVLPRKVLFEVRGHSAWRLVARRSFRETTWQLRRRRPPGPKSHSFALVELSSGARDERAFCVGSRCKIARKDPSSRQLCRQLCRERQ